MPSDVEVLDGGTGGFELVGFFRGRKKIVILDALLADEPPGSVLAATPKQLDLRWGNSFSSHDSGLRELINQTRGLYPTIEFLILGIVPHDCETAGTDLSPALQSLVPQLASMALAHATSTPRSA
jgi:hydrogenase maturation protease